MATTCPRRIITAAALIAASMLCTALICLAPVAAFASDSGTPQQDQDGATAITAEVHQNGDYWYRLTGSNADKARIVAYTGSAAKLSIPAKLDGHKVVSVAGLDNVYQDAYPDGRTRRGVFDGCTQLRSIVLPKSCTTIGYYAFANCTNLASVTLPAKLKRINPNAFQNCSALTSIDLPKTLYHIGSYTFDGTGITSLRIPGACSIIPYRAFNGMGELARIEFAKGCKRIASYYGLFEGCDALEEIILPATIGYVHPRAFQHCAATKVKVSSANKVYKMSGGLLIDTQKSEIVHAFASFAKTTYTLPAQIKRIGAWAFADNRTIKTLVVSKNCTLIGANAFDGCRQLKKAKLGGKLKTIKGEAFHGTGLAKLTLGSKVAKIGQRAFYPVGTKGYTKSPLRSVKLPASLKQIGTAAFGYYMLADGRGTVDKSFTVKAKKGSPGIKYAKKLKLKYTYL